MLFETSPAGEYPEDTLAYKKLADSYWLDSPEDLTVSEMARVATLYQQALDVEDPLEDPSIVSDRLDEVER